MNLLRQRHHRGQRGSVEPAPGQRERLQRDEVQPGEVQPGEVRRHRGDAAQQPTVPVAVDPAGRVMTDGGGRVLVVDDTGHLVPGPARPPVEEPSRRKRDRRRGRRGAGAEADGSAVTEAGPVVEAGPVTDDRPVAEKKVGRRVGWAFSPWQLFSLAAGLALCVVGLVALVRAGVDGDLATPEVDVVGYSHTAVLGIVETGFGILLVVAGTTPTGRPLALLMGALLVLAGALVVIEPARLPEDLALEEDFGWVAAIGGAAVVVAALVLPTFASKHRTLER